MTNIISTFVETSRVYTSNNLYPAGTKTVCDLSPFKFHNAEDHVTAIAAIIYVLDQQSIINGGSNE